MTTASTHAQQHVSPHQLFMASAGTGKTFRLSGAYLRHAIEEWSRAKAGGDGDAASILAMTFTRKAAGEITDRVLGMLAAAIASKDKHKDLVNAVGADVEESACGPLLGWLLDQLDRLSISTIDAYFMKIAQAFALELGVPPGWRIADDLEDQQLRAAAILEVLSVADRAELLNELTDLARGRLGRSVLQTMLRSVNAAYSAYLQSDGRAEAWHAIQPNGTCLEKDALGKIIRTVQSIDLPQTKAGEPNKNWQKAIDQLLDSCHADDWDGFVNTTFVKAILTDAPDGPKYSRVIIGPEWIAGLSPLIEHARFQMLKRFCDQNAAVYRLAARFDEAYSRQKATRGLYRFDDVPRLLLDSSLRDRMEDVYFRMDARIRHLLLDEFQDTSITQFRLLEPILDELLSADEGRSVFCVGDVKQSLYGWRGAEPDLMHSLPRRWESLRPCQLGRSYRSSEVITDTVNAVFQELESNAALAGHGETVTLWKEAFTRHSTEKDLPGAACLRTAGVDAEEKPDVVRCTVNRVASMIKESDPASIGVLVRARKHIPGLVHALRRAGIEASEEGGSPLADAPPVAAALSLLQLADYPGDSAAAFHIASGPIGPIVGLIDPFDVAQVETVSAQVRRDLAIEGYAVTLRRLLDGIAGHMDARGFERFQHLLSLAAQFDERAGLRPSEFVKLARASAIEDPSRSRVRVMTIHASKGLEFEGVVLPDLDRRWEVGKDSFLVSRAGPLAPVRAVTRAPSEVYRSLHDDLAAVHAESLARAVREELSCLYVAMTRAIHHLEMIIAPGKKDDLTLSAASVLRAALAPSASLQPDTVLWQSTPFQAWRGDRTRAVEPQARSAVPLTLKPSSTARSSRLASVSPSSLESGARRLDGLFSARGEAARREGTLLHAWCELIEWLDDAQPTPDALEHAARTLGWSSRDVAGSILLFQRALTTPFAEVFRRASVSERPAVDRVEVRREWPFEVRVPIGPHKRDVGLVGRFDRLVIGWSGAQARWAEIIDFKSDALEPAGDAAHLESLSNYEPQIAAYARAVEAMFGLDPIAVSARLAFVRSGRVIDVPLGR